MTSCQSEGLFGNVLMNLGILFDLKENNKK